MSNQLELLYRKVLVVYPAAGHSARRPIRARVDDGLDYMLKDDSGGAPVRAREWICHGLADLAGLPVLECRPILDGGGRVLFGSRYLLNGGPGGLTGYKILAGTLPLAEARTVFSALYAVDFSEAPALIDAAQRGKIPSSGTATVNVGRTLRTLYGFSPEAATRAMGRLQQVTGDQLKEILDRMPADWLPAHARDDLIKWRRRLADEKQILRHVGPVRYTRRRR